MNHDLHHGHDHELGMDDYLSAGHALFVRPLVFASILYTRRKCSSRVC